MPNKNYLKGVRKERKIVNAARAQDLISFRSAGSHSCIDVAVIDPKTRRIYFYQCKPDSMSETAKQHIIFKHSDIPGTYEVFYEVV